jgi:hypothetical protein
VEAMSRFDKDILDKDILVHQMKDSIKEQTWNYHNKLMELLEAKTHGDGEGGKKMDKLFRDVCKDFGSVVDEWIKRQYPRKYINKNTTSEQIEGIKKVFGGSDE